MDVAGMDVAGCGLCGVAHVDAAVGAGALHVAAHVAVTHATTHIAAHIAARLGCIVCGGARCARCLGTDKGGRCKYTDICVRRVFGKCPKGVTQEHELIPVKP